MATDIKVLCKTLSELTKEECIEVLKEMKDVYGIVPPEPEVIEVAAKEVVVEEQSEFIVKMTDMGPNKLKLVKMFKDITNMSLTDSKHQIEEPTGILVEKATKDVAERIKASFEELGATVALL
jgi:large subunit ribosomal protein L7/L12